MYKTKIKGISNETAQRFGIALILAAEYVRTGEAFQKGITADDFRCDADSNQKLEYLMKKIDK
jgi:hypothetical protein